MIHGPRNERAISPNIRPTRLPMTAVYVGSVPVLNRPFQCRMVGEVILPSKTPVRSYFATEFGRIFVEVDTGALPQAKKQFWRFAGNELKKVRAIPSRREKIFENKPICRPGFKPITNLEFPFYARRDNGADCFLREIYETDYGYFVRVESCAWRPTITRYYLLSQDGRTSSVLEVDQVPISPTRYVAIKTIRTPWNDEPLTMLREYQFIPGT